MVGQRRQGIRHGLIPRIGVYKHGHRSRCSRGIWGMLISRQHLKQRVHPLDRGSCRRRLAWGTASRPGSGGNKRRSPGGRRGSWLRKGTSCVEEGARHFEGPPVRSGRSPRRRIGVRGVQGARIPARRAFTGRRIDCHVRVTVAVSECGLSRLVVVMSIFISLGRRRRRNGIPEMPGCVVVVVFDFNVMCCDVQRFGQFQERHHSL